MNFKEQPEYLRGHESENELKKIMEGAGHVLMSLHAIEEGGAPSVTASNGDQIVLPDFQTFRSFGASQAFVEVKDKTKPSWYRLYDRWEHGIDYAHFKAYQRCQDETGVKICITLKQH